MKGIAVAWLTAESSGSSPASSITEVMKRSACRRRPHRHRSRRTLACQPPLGPSARVTGLALAALGRAAL